MKFYCKLQNRNENNGIHGSADVWVRYFPPVVVKKKKDNMESFDCFVVMMNTKLLNLRHSAICQAKVELKSCES